MQTIKPASKHLFCKPLEAETQTKSGFFLPGGAAEKPQMAVVVHVGAHVREYAVGDTIIYKPYSTTDIKFDGQNFFLVAEEDVLGKVVDEDSK